MQESVKKIFLDGIIMKRRIIVKCLILQDVEVMEIILIQTKNVLKHVFKINLNIYYIRPNKRKR